MISWGQLDPRVATDLPKVVELQPGAGLGLDGAGQQHTETAVSTPPAPALPDPLHQAAGREPSPAPVLTYSSTLLTWKSSRDFCRLLSAESRGGLAPDFVSCAGLAGASKVCPGEQKAAPVLVATG